MNKLFCGAMAVTGCVLLAGAGVAETSHVRGYEKKSDGRVSPHEKPSPYSPKFDRWSPKGHANPQVGKEETKDLLRAKRPK